MKSNFLNRFMKKLTGERVVPTISGQGLLVDFWNHNLRRSFLAKMSQDKQDTRQSLLAGIKQLVDQVLFIFITDIAGQQIRHEHVAQSALSLNQKSER
jgi:hypothetical protein